MFPAILVTWILHLTCIRARQPTCSLRPTVLPVDAPYYRFFPYYVELLRCAGACTVSPATQICSAKTVSDYRFSAVNIFTLERQTMTLKNHTSCGCSCVKKASDCDPQLESWNEDHCSCNCNYADSPPVPCEDNLEWDGNRCKCICNRPPELCEGNSQEWSNEACGCVCQERVVKRCVRKQKFLDSKKCECVETPPAEPTTGKRSGSNGLDSGMFVGALVAEFLLLVVAFDLFLCCKHQKGVIYSICCASRLQETRNGQHPQTESPSPAPQPLQHKMSQPDAKTRQGFSVKRI